MRHILASLLLFAAVATPVAAHADDLYNYSFSGTGVSGAGTFTIPSTTADGSFLVSSITGQVNGANITGLLPVDAYKGNDNLFFNGYPYLDNGGVSFGLDNGADVNIFFINGDWFFQGDGNFVLDTGGVNSISSSLIHSSITADTTVQITDLSFAPATAVTPEPSSFMLLGTGVLGAAGMFRRRFNKA
jgi:hypothetical protein